MAFFATTKLVLLIGFMFFESVLHSTQFILTLVILFFISVFIYVFFLLRTIRNQPQRSLQINDIARCNTKTGPNPQRKSSIGDRYRTSNTNPADGAIDYYIELDNDPHLPSIGYTTSNISALPNIPEEPTLSGRNVADQGPSNAQTMSPVMCETIAEIGPSGNNGDVKICLTLKSSEVQQCQTRRNEPNVSRSHSERLPKGVTTDVNQVGASGRSTTLPRIHVTNPAGQSAEPKCMTLGKKAGESTDISHEYMPMGNVLYTDMDYALGTGPYEN